MSTALARREVTNPAKFGDKYEIEAVKARIVKMMPGALKAPDEIVWAAAQLAVAYRLDPFNGELYIMPTGRKQDDKGNWVDDYKTHIGIKGQRKIARRKSDFVLNVRTMDPEEVKQYRREDYMPNDIGVEATVIRLDLAQKFKAVGIQYSGSVGRGFWRVKAKFNKNEWSADNIPNTWSAYEVAEKRAEVNALKKAFDMTFEVADPAIVDDEDIVETMGYKIAEHDRNHSLFAEREQSKEADGDILFGYDDGTKPKHRRPQQAPIIPDPVIPTGEEESAEDGVTDGEWEFTSIAPTDIIADEGVPEPVRDWVKALRKRFVGGCKLASDKQVDYARKCVEVVTGKDTFAEVYAVLAPVGYEDEAMPLSVAEIFFTLPQKRRTQNQESGKWDTVENEKYDPGNVEFLDIVAKWVVRQNEIDS